METVSASVTDLVSKPNKQNGGAKEEDTHHLTYTHMNMCMNPDIINPIKRGRDREILGACLLVILAE